jgi:hypothetical protein
MGWQARTEAGGTEFWKLFGLQKSVHAWGRVLSTVLLAEPTLNESQNYSRTAHLTPYNDNLESGFSEASRTFELRSPKLILNLALNRLRPAAVHFEPNFCKASDQSSTEVIFYHHRRRYQSRTSPSLNVSIRVFGLYVRRVEFGGRGLRELSHINRKY